LHLHNSNAMVICALLQVVAHVHQNLDMIVLKLN